MTTWVRIYTRLRRATTAAPACNFRPNPQRDNGTVGRVGRDASGAARRISLSRVREQAIHAVWLWTETAPLLFCCCRTEPRLGPLSRNGTGGPGRGFNATKEQRRTFQLRKDSILASSPVAGAAYVLRLQGQPRAVRWCSRAVSVQLNGLHGGARLRSSP